MPLLVAVLVAAAALAAVQPADADAAAKLVVSGRGWGHGIGMSQWGARGFAVRGWRYSQILAHYYRGTTLARADEGRIRVLLAQRGTITFGSTAAFTLVPAEGEPRELESGTHKVAALDLEGSWTLKPGAAPLEILGTHYRGTVELRRAGRTIQAINTVPMREYLHGVVPDEMPPFWPHEALKAQAVVARSYALTSLRPGAAFDVTDDTRSQVYNGIEAEDWRASAAVDATAGEVVSHQGEVAHTFFFSTSGGRTAAIADEWPNAQKLPYLVSVSDPYDAASPHHTWGPVAFDWAQVRKRLGKGTPMQPGGLAVRRNGSRRVTAVAFGASTRFSGADLRSKLGLRSTWFTLDLLALDNPRPIAPGARATLTGRVVGVRQVALEKRVEGQWLRLGPLRIRKGGRILASVSPAETTLYRIVSGDQPGPVVRLRVETG